MLPFTCSIFAGIANSFYNFFLEVLATAARLNNFLNPLLKPRKIYVSSLNYSTTLEGFFDRCSVEDNKICHKFVTIFANMFNVDIKLKLFINK